MPNKYRIRVLMSFVSGIIPIYSENAIGKAPNNILIKTLVSIKNKTYMPKTNIPTIIGIKK